MLEFAHTNTHTHTTSLNYWKGISWGECWRNTNTHKIPAIWRINQIQWPVCNLNSLWLMGFLLSVKLTNKCDRGRMRHPPFTYLIYSYCIFHVSSVLSSFVCGLFWIGLKYCINRSPGESNFFFLSNFHFIHHSQYGCIRNELRSFRSKRAYKFAGKRRFFITTFILIYYFFFHCFAILPIPIDLI